MTRLMHSFCAWSSNAGSSSCPNEQIPPLPPAKRDQRGTVGSTNQRMCQLLAEARFVWKRRKRAGCLRDTEHLVSTRRDVFYVAESFVRNRTGKPKPPSYDLIGQRLSQEMFVAHSSEATVSLKVVEFFTC
jgi:hypothetical protein